VTALTLGASTAVDALARSLGEEQQAQFVSGTGQFTSVDEVVAVLGEHGRRLLRLQCYEGQDETEALYEWDDGKQLLYTQILREKIGQVVADAPTLESAVDRIGAQESVFFSERFLASRPLLEAIRSEQPVVLLIDEVDRADEALEAGHGHGHGHGGHDDHPSRPAAVEDDADEVDGRAVRAAKDTPGRFRPHLRQQPPRRRRRCGAPEAAEGAGGTRHPQLRRRPGRQARPVNPAPRRVTATGTATMTSPTPAPSRTSPSARSRARPPSRATATANPSTSATSSTPRTSPSSTTCTRRPTRSTWPR